MAGDREIGPDRTPVKNSVCPRSEDRGHTCCTHAYGHLLARKRSSKPFAFPPKTGSYIRIRLEKRIPNARKKVIRSTDPAATSLYSHRSLSPTLTTTLPTVCPDSTGASSSGSRSACWVIASLSAIRTTTAPGGSHTTSTICAIPCLTGIGSIPSTTGSSTRA